MRKPKYLVSFMAAIKCTFFIGWAMVCFPFVFCLYSLRHYLPMGLRAFIIFYWRGGLKILGIRIHVTGHMTAERPLLFLSNHISYFDIPILGSVLPGCFVAKSDMMGWPVIGYLTRLSGSIFIDRRRSQVKDQKDRLLELLQTEAAPLILFPEGTTGNGQEVKPFKSSLFSLVEHQLQETLDAKEMKHITLQPVSIVYTHVGSRRLEGADHDLIAWYGDMALTPHFWQALKLPAIHCHVIIHGPIDLRTFSSRKDLAAHCEKIVQKGFTTLLPQD